MLWPCCPGLRGYPATVLCLFYVGLPKSYPSLTISPQRMSSLESIPEWKEGHLLFVCLFCFIYIYLFHLDPKHPVSSILNYHMPPRDRVTYSLVDRIPGKLLIWSFPQHGLMSSFSVQLVASITMPFPCQDAGLLML